MHKCFQMPSMMPSMMHGTPHNQSPGAFEAFVNNHAAAQALLQQEDGARYNRKRLPQIKHQIQPSHWPATIQSPFQFQVLQSPTDFDPGSAPMSRNNRHHTNPFSHRGRDQYELACNLPLQVQQALLDLFCGNLPDPGYRGCSWPGRPNAGPTYADFLDQDITQRRNFASGDCGTDPQAMRPADRNRHSRANMAGQGKHGQPIGKSMKKLHKLLGDAEEAYQKFLGDFDSETDSIKQYAKAALLIELWQRKVDGKKANADDEDSGEPSDFAKSHEGMKKKLAAALNTAICSTVGENKGPRAAIRLEDADRLRQKADTASAQIMDLLNKVPKNREYCVSLLNEFAVLKEMIDPTKDANKKVYRSGDSADEGASDAEGDADEQDDDYY
ncbi:hypothetical protein IFR04_006280 [Cadophora malorum]|uniref:Uncharacterized protein n=1 Tax=Cadophora malorum TaxID=108018 RepID=A0A8H7TKG9_9HELO|nr:hypothetical protein IFR04_006280 [Cadophora malorum]